MLVPGGVQYKLSWAAPWYQVPYVTTYTVQACRLNAATSCLTTVVPVPVPVTGNVESVIPGLELGGVYNITVAASNSYGTSYGAPMKLSLTAGTWRCRVTRIASIHYRAVV